MAGPSVHPSQLLAPAPTPPRCVAVLRLTALGDVVLTTGVVAALKAHWPDTQVVYVTRSAFAPLIRHHPSVSQVVTWDHDMGVGAMARQLRSVGVDAVLDLHGKVRTRALTAAVAPTLRARWVKRPWQDNLPVRLRLRPYRAQMTISQRYHLAAQALARRVLAAQPLALHLGEPDRVAAESLLAAAGIRNEHTVVCLCPGANWETKRWPSERFAQVAKDLMDNGVRVVLSGSGAEAALVAQVAQAAPGAVDLAGKMDLGALAGVLARCAAVVANDSGPMHMARALGVPTLAFFGSTDPTQFEWDGHARLFAQEPCSPCSFYGLPRCPKGHFRCMNTLEAHQASQAIQQLLSQTGTPRVNG